MPQIRHAVRVLLVDQDDRLLLFRSEHPETGSVFWFPAGGGLAGDEDLRAAATREIAEETGLTDVALGPEVWHRRHVFSWRGVRWDQRERWLLARVAHFEPDRAGMTDIEHQDLTSSKWWTLELQVATDELVSRDLAAHLRTIVVHGPPATPIDVGGCCG